MAVQIDHWHFWWNTRTRNVRKDTLKAPFHLFLEKFHDAYVHVSISFSSLFSFLNFFIEISERTARRFAMKEDEGKQRLESSAQAA